MRKLRDVLVAVLLEVVGWSAFVLAPIAVLFARLDAEPSVGGWADDLTLPTTRRATLPWGFRWLDAPDDRLPGGMYEPDVRRWLATYGWRVCSVLWLWRNRAFGLAWVFGRDVATEAEAPWRIDWTWRFLRGTLGWKVYRKGLYSKPLIAIPAVSIRFNKPAAT
jgi:hypothetical protein